MRSANGSKLGDVSALVKVVAKLPIDGQDQADRRRRLVAELCKLIGAQTSNGNGKTNDNGGGGALAHLTGLSPRMRQTLGFLIQGDSERQIALKLKISQHTVHVYVRQLYKRFDVNSRGELLARFIR
jgi:DNA-binding CsgD family transcriptional regulator